MYYIHHVAPPPHCAPLPQDWKKHWFVLTGNSLRYYKDAKAEETNALDGRIDLSSCYEITEVQIQRNYGFKIKVASLGNGFLQKEKMQ